MSGRRKAVFFDRDGTLMEEVHYCADPALVRVYAGVPEALRRVRAAGYLTFIITNQSGIGRGLMTEAQYRDVQQELMAQIGEPLIDATYYCADAPGVPSTRRKPEPGMLLEAAANFNLDLSQCFVIGDKAADIECGSKVGSRTVLVLTGYGREQKCRPDFVAEDISAAVELVVYKAL